MENNPIDICLLLKRGQRSVLQINLVRNQAFILVHVGEDKVISERSRGERKCVSPLQTSLFLCTSYHISIDINADGDNDLR